MKTSDARCATRKRSYAVFVRRAPAVSASTTPLPSPTSSISPIVTRPVERRRARARNATAPTRAACARIGAVDRERTPDVEGCYHPERPEPRERPSRTLGAPALVAQWIEHLTTD